MDKPLAYFLTFSTYGTWLHGRDQGSVDRENNGYGAPFLTSDADRERLARESMQHDVYMLDEKRRFVVLETIKEVAHHRNWQLRAVHVRTNHVHVIVVADDSIEKIINDFKAWCSRRLKEALNESAALKRWTQHGSTRYLWNEDQLSEKIDYVLNQQGPPLALFDGSKSEPEASARDSDNQIPSLRFGL